MDIEAVLLPRDIEEKLWHKHHISREEIEEVLERAPRLQFAEKGHIHGQDLYRAIGQTEGGRCLVIFFIRKPDQFALVISARDLTAKERKQYAKK
jgi:uncharacterized protein